MNAAIHEGATEPFVECRLVESMRSARPSDESRTPAAAIRPREAEEKIRRVFRRARHDDVVAVRTAIDDDSPISSVSCRITDLLT